MTGRQRFFTYAAATVGVLVLGWMVLIGAVFLVGGVATVQIVERNEGINLSLPIPMAIIHAAAATTEVLFLDEIIEEIEIDTHGRFADFAPMALGLLEALDDAPNGTVFVEVHDHQDHVRVLKSRGKIRVEVDTPDILIKVAVPTRSIKRIVRQIVR